MATAPITEPTVSAPAKASMLPLLLTVVLAGTLSVAGSAGALVYLVKSGHLQLPAAPQPKEVQIERRPEGPSHTVALEPMVVNLADAGGAAYLRLGLSVRIMDDPTEKPKAEEKPKAGGGELEASLRDIVLTVAGRQTTTSLLDAEGKTTLKKQLRDALAEQQPQLRVLDLYFTEFLVQR